MIDPGTCTDGNVCTNDTCTAIGCVGNPVGGPCDDGDTCTTNDQCHGGVCFGTPPDTDVRHVGWNDKVTLRWDTAGPVSYDVVRGAVGPLHQIGDFAHPSVLTNCQTNDASSASTVDTTVPIAGKGLWYLARATHGCGQVGTYNDGTEEHDRDPRIALNVNSCP